MRRLSAALLMCCLAPRPAAAQLTDRDRAALGDLGPSFAMAFELKHGWYRGRPASYYDFGPADVTISPMFLVATGLDPGGAPRLLPGQRPIFSSIPGVSGYSALWQVHYLVVGPGYAPNSVRDARQAVAMALRGEARLVVPGFFVNCPIVPQGSSLEGDPDSRQIEVGWYKGQEVAYFDFGRSPLAPAPIYAFVSGMSDGEPRFVREQGNLVDVVPGDGAEYRDMWDVHFVVVDSAYQPNRLRDVGSLLAEAAAGTLSIRRAGSVRNCPVVLVGGARAPRLGQAP